MPIEIRELTIKVTVDQPSPQAQQPGGGAPAAGGGAAAGGDKDSVLAQCVEQILDIMKNKRER